MSEREKHIHKLPGQRPYLERKIYPVGYIPERPEFMNDMILDKFNDNPDLLEFYKSEKKFYLKFFDVRKDIAQGKGSVRFNRFVARYGNEDSKYFKAERFSEGKPILDYINSVLFSRKAIGKR